MEKKLTEISDLGELVRGDFRCDCAKNQEIPIERVEVDEEAFLALRSYLERHFSGGVVQLVADENTYDAAASKLFRGCSGGNFKIEETVYRREGKLHPDERAVAQLLRDYDPRVDVLLALGSGTINDLARYVAHKVDRPFISLPTAPSVDGFSSTVSSLIVDGFKKTLSASPPRAIFADLEVLAEAPRRMIAAGLGDLLGKYTSNSDWVLSHLINEEYFCPDISAFVRKLVRKAVKDPAALRRGDEEGIRLLIEGLISSGVAIMMVGSSRPASGAEHHFSHYWEMKGLMEGEDEFLHGEKVAVATPTVSAIYHKAFREGPRFKSWEELEREFLSVGQREELIAQYYGPAADALIEENRGRYGQWGERKERVERIYDRWGEVVASLEDEIPPPEKVREILGEVGAPRTPEELGVPRIWFAEALEMAKEIRNRYTILQLAEDVGMELEMDQFI